MPAKVKYPVICLVGLFLAFSNHVNPSLAQTTPYPTRLTWQRIDYPVLPSPRTDFSLALNPINQVALLFGGWTYPDGGTNDLWLFNGRQWMAFYTPHSPAKRSGSSMVYDEERQNAVLFGGAQNSPAYLLFNDTWVFNGIDWVEQSPAASPSPRAGASMVYDPERKLTYLFGGFFSEGKDYRTLGDMWAWDGADWKEMTPAVRPASRTRAPMVYDPVHHHILLFGGNAVAAPLNDTWTWDGSAWSELHPAHSPSFVFHSGSMAYDPVHQQMILVGVDFPLQGEIHTETWAWDGQDWTELQPAQPLPEALVNSGELVYLPALQAVAMFGEYYVKSESPDQSIERSEVWALVERYTSFLPIISQ